MTLDREISSVFAASSGARPRAVARGRPFRRRRAMRVTPDFRLFCLALRQPAGAEDRDALYRAIAAGTDWRRQVTAARRHSVASLLLGALQACGSPDPPPAVMAELRRQSVAAAKRSLTQASIIARLSPGFAAAGVRMLALKGVVLSAQLYGDPAQRGPRDIDLLVDPEQFEAARALLIQNGFQAASPSLSPRQSSAHRRWIKDVEFVHTATGIPLELHHRLADNPELLSGDFAELWRQREEVAIAGNLTATLPRQQLPLYLCVHGAGHAWERLRWLVDFAAAVREIGPGAALAAAQASGLDAAMLHALMLAHDWLGLPVAEDLLGEARADPRVARLDRLLAPLYAGEAWHQAPPRGSLAGVRRYSVWQRLYRLSLKSNWRYRARQAVREFVSPADWGTVRLPDWLFWLYPLVRPVGWLMRRRRR